MPDVIGIRFKSCGRVYDFEVNGVEVRKGDRVIVESEFGLSIGNVVVGPHKVENPAKDLKKVLRVANEEDLRQKQENEAFERESKAFCLERIMARGLPMRLVCAEVTLDKKRIIFYFTADGRIDFRELVKDLAAKFKTRIEMRQIGVRDKAKLVGGLGLCGKELCCRLFLTSFEPISIKMAKQQDLTLNTGKLSGICGRLMCCLGYEYQNGSPEPSHAPNKKTLPEPAEEFSEAAPEETEPVLTGAVCCDLAPPKESPSPQPGKTAEQQKTDKFKKHKKRRRFRKRFQKNE
ncbi:MAG: stage 0 sporulation family protein [Nitrospirae bacterium]|nr:stage 0 sporulation family protein [Nitrospirota bacterium]